MSDDIHRILGRIEGKLDEIDTRFDDFKDHIESHSERITELEGLKNKAWGFIIAVGAAGAAVGTSITKAFASIFHP